MAKTIFQFIAQLKKITEKRDDRSGLAGRVGSLRSSRDIFIFGKKYRLRFQLTRNQGEMASTSLPRRYQRCHTLSVSYAVCNLRTFYHVQ